MGRKTFKNIKILGNDNEYMVLTRSSNFFCNKSNVKVINKIEEIPNSDRVWICGGEEIYRQTLSSCRYLFLSTVKVKVKGDKCLPQIENDFILKEKIYCDEEVLIEKYCNKRMED